jgi:DNA gyrase/topoisomerase IV subunit B
VEENQDYSKSSIKTLTFREAVRKRPAMYVGTVGAAGGFMLMKNIAREILDVYPETELKIFIEKGDEIKISFLIKNNELSELFSFLGDPPLSKDKLYMLSYIKVTTALSDNFQLTVKAEKEIVSRTYKEGVEIVPRKEMNSSDAEYVDVEFKFSFPMLESEFLEYSDEKHSLAISFSSDDSWRFIQYLNQLACIFPTVKISIEDDRLEAPTKLFIYRPNGLVDLLAGNSIQPAYFTNEHGFCFHFTGKEKEISYQIVIDDRHVPIEGLEKMVFFNGEFCHHGCSHAKAINDAIRELSEKIKTEGDVGHAYERSIDDLNIYVSVNELESVSDLKWQGPTKYIFISPSIYESIKAVVYEKLRIRCKENKHFSSIIANLTFPPVKLS